MNLSIFYPAIALLPGAFFAIHLKLRERAQAAKAVELPIGTDEKFLRSPGESILQKKIELDDKILGSLVFIFVSPPCLLTAYLSIPADQRLSPGFWILWLVVLPVYGWFMIRGFRQWSRFYDERQNWLLGYRGERAVGEYLNQLMLHGCRVFHDFPLNGRRNLDHIVVAPSGVFAIETKAKSHSSNRPEKDNVEYDGEKLIFHDKSWDEDDLRQSKSQAALLHAKLRKDLGPDIWITPILVLVGWSIKRSAPGDVRVVSHTELRSAILDPTHPVLTSEGIKRISKYLDSKCRDVAF